MTTLICKGLSFLLFGGIMEMKIFLMIIKFMEEINEIF